MANSVIDNVDLTVFGGPQTINLSLDYGQQGIRGSKTWAGNGDPSISLSGQSIQINDTYLNIDPADTYYGWTYQYVEEVGSPVWTRILAPIKSDYSAIATTTFTAGATTINVPVSSLTTNSSPSISRFIVRYNVENTTPVSSSFTYSLTGSYPNQNIAIVINAVTYSGGTWSNLTGSKNVHLYVTYK